MPDEVKSEFFTAHQQRVAAELRSSDEHKLFPLRLSKPSTSTKWRARIADVSGTVEVSGYQFLDDAANEPVVVIGDPGSGKTTLLESFALERVQAGDPTFFLRMGLWSKTSDITQQLGVRLPADDVLTILDSGNSWVFFDALDEAEGQAIDEAFRAVRDFVQAHPLSRVIASCRAAQVPAWAANQFSAARILPLSPTQVAEGLEDAMKEGQVPVRAEVVTELRDLCSNPLMLAMTQELLLSGDALVLNITSPSQLYERFIDFIDAREWGKRPPGDIESQLRAGLNLNLLGAIAWNLTSVSQSSVEEAELGRWLWETLTDSRWQQWWSEREKPSVPDLVRILSARAPARMLQSPTGGLPRFSLMHLTFRDALAARYLKDMCRSAGSCDLICSVAEDKSEKHWPAIVFYAGSEPDSGATARLIVDRALRTRNQDLLRLACLCISNRWNIPPEDVDDLLLIILDAFKNWDRAFDYDLMRTIQGLMARLSKEFPERLREDLDYFINKYAEEVPRRLNAPTLSGLVKLLDLPPGPVVIDALFTLAHQQLSSGEQRKEIVAKILALIPTWPVPLIEQAVAALKDIKDDSSLPALREIVADRQHSHRAVAFAANAIAEAGTEPDIELIANLLLDHSFMYRDSASWSLQKLADRLSTEVPELRASVLAVYVRALNEETGDAAGRYAKGNILYSMGMLKAQEYVSAVEKILTSESDPYVLEDGLLALGLLRTSSSVPVVRGYLRNGDPAVRLKAAEALRNMAALTNEEVARLAQDRYRVIRHFADQPVAVAEPTDEILHIRMAAAALARGPVGGQGPRADFRLSTEEREALAYICRRDFEAGLMKAQPVFLDDGQNHEIRLHREDLEPLLQRLRVESNG